MVSLLKAGLIDAAEALEEWAIEWLDYDDEQLEDFKEELDVTDT